MNLPFTGLRALDGPVFSNNQCRPAGWMDLHAEHCKTAFIWTAFRTAFTDRERMQGRRSFFCEERERERRSKIWWTIERTAVHKIHINIVCLVWTLPHFFLITTASWHCCFKKCFWQIHKTKKILETLRVCTQALSSATNLKRCGSQLSFRGKVKQ